MIIGIDIRFLARGTRTGIEEYTLNLLARLLPLDKSIKYKLFYNAYHKINLDYNWLKLPNVELKEFQLPNRLVFDPLAICLSQPKIDRLLGKVDVFWSPHFLLTPLSRKCNRVLTFHDLSFEYFPEFFPWRKRVWHKTLRAKNQAQKADRLIAVSESTRDDLVELYRVPENKIKIIYSGVGEEFGQIGKNNKQLSSIKHKYKLPEKFILYFGTLEPRKNLVGLIKAFEIFRQKNKNGYKLVIAGSNGWLFKDIFETAKKSPWSKDIIFTGFINPADKVYLYNLASLFIYPSFFEGFGFPPLEAMASGVPVICSNTSSFPEVAGEGAIMIDPTNFGEIAWAMTEILNDSNLQRHQTSAGLIQVKKFSWDICARQTLDVLLDKK